MFARGFHARRWHCPRACGEVHLVPNVGVSRDPEVFEISAPCPRRNTVKYERVCRFAKLWSSR